MNRFLLLALILTATSLSVRGQCPMPATTPPAVLDSCFLAPTASVFTLAQILQKANGSILGMTYNPPPGFSAVLQFSAEGNLDSVFRVASNALDYTPTSIALTADGKLVFAGSRQQNTSIPMKITRLNGDGTLDTSFHTDFGGSGFGASTVKAVLPQGDKVVAAGQFYYSITRLLANGGFDPSWRSGTGFAWDSDPEGGLITNLKTFPDGMILATGKFDEYNRAPRFHIVRLKADGPLDSSFNANSVFVRQDQVQNAWSCPDGKVLVAALFAGSPRPQPRFIRLTSDGSYDGTFTTGAGFDQLPVSVVHQPDGKILVAGPFTTINGVRRNGIARLHVDGSVDAGFDPRQGFESGVASSLQMQGDSKVLVGGTFSQYDTRPVGGLARLFVTSSALATQPTLDAGRLSLLPNPATTSATLQSSERIQKIELASSNGKRTPAALHSDGKTISLVNTPPGLYTVIAQTQTGKVLRSRLAVVR